MSARALYADFATVILHDLMDCGEAQSDAFCLSIADEGLKEVFANWVGDPRTVICHSNFDTPLGHRARYVNLPESGGTASQAFNRRFNITRSILSGSNQPSHSPL